MNGIGRSPSIPRACRQRPGLAVVSARSDLVAGSGIEFEDRGTHELKGVPASGSLPLLADAFPAKPPGTIARISARVGAARPRLEAARMSE
jgi:hypothetical protein